MVADIDLQAAEAVASSCRQVATVGAGIRVEAVHVDVMSEDSVVRMTTVTLRAFPRIDYCLNNAGVSRCTPTALVLPLFAFLTACSQIGVEDVKAMAEASATEFERFQQVNVTGTFLVLRHVSAAMKLQQPRLVQPELPKRGSCRGTMVNMGSLASFVPQAGMVQYTASKHAVVGLSKNAGK